MTNEDKHIRDILLGGTEPVPAGAWEAVSKGLDKAAAAPRRRVVWLWSAVGSLAAAAAVAAAVVVIPGHNPAGPSKGSDIIAGVEDSPAVVIDRPVIEEKVSISEQIASSPTVRSSFAQELRAAMPVEETPVSGMQEDSPVAGESVVPAEELAPAEEAGTSVPEGVKSEVKGQEETKPEISAPANTEADPFALMLARDSRAGSKPMAITIGGSALGGSVPQGGKSSGIKMAPGLPTTGIREEGHDIYGLPLSLGLGVRIPIIPRLSVGTGINYTMLGRSFTGTYTEATGGVITKQLTSVTISEKLHYLGIPVNIYYDVVSNSRFTATAWMGSSLDLNVGHGYRVPDASGPISYKVSTHGLQPSLGAGIGLQYNILPSIGLYAEPGVRYYFNAGQPRSIRTVQPWMFGMEIGLRYNLGK